MVKVSVIVPAFNVDKYIEECIKSIQKQTLTDIEIIVVNDESTDDTKRKIENLSRYDIRIKLINKKNEGVLAARGTGCREASGKYVINIDGDDWIEETCCEEMYNLLEKTSADIAMCDFKEQYRNNNIIGNTGEFTKINKQEYISRFLIGEVSCYIWTRMIRRELLKDIDFGQDISLGDDTYINIELMDRINTLVKVNKPLINYRVRSKSLTKKYDDSIYHIWNIINNLKNKDFIKNNNLFSDEVDMFIYQHVFIGRILDKANFNKSIHRNMYDRYKQQKIDIYNNKYFKNSISIKHKILTYVFLANYELGIKVNNIIRFIQKNINRQNLFKPYP